MKTQNTVSPAPNLDGLTSAQRDHVLGVFPESRALMADYLRQGVEVIIGRQNEASVDVPPVAISVVANPEFWIDCVESESEALAHAAALGLVVVNVDPQTA
jgi:hypothetical protein